MNPESDSDGMEESENYEDPESPRIPDTIWAHATVVRLDRESLTSFEMLISATFDELGIYLGPGALLGDNTNELSEIEPPKCDLVVSKLHGLLGKKNFGFHVSWGNTKIGQSVAQFSYPAFASKYNRNLSLNMMSPFFVVLFNHLELSFDLLLDEEDSYYLYQTDQIVERSRSFAQFVLDLQQSNPRDRMGKLKCVITENFTDQKLWHLPEILDQANLFELFGVSNLRQLLRTYSMMFYTMFRVMIATGYVHGDISPRNIKLAKSLQRNFPFMKGPYAFHVDRYTFIPGIDSTKGLIPLLFPTRYGFFESDLWTLSKQQLEDINDRYTSTDTLELGKFGVDWLMAPEHVFDLDFDSSESASSRPHSNHESDLFCLGVCLVVLALAKTTGNLLSTVTKNVFYSEFLKTLPKSIPKHKAEAAAYLGVLLGFDRISESIFGSSPLYRSLKKYSRTINTLHDGLSGVLLDAFGEHGMSMINSMLSWDRRNRIILYLDSSIMYFVPFTVMNSSDETMSASTLYPREYNHWGIQSELGGCIGLLDDRTDSIVLPPKLYDDESQIDFGSHKILAGKRRATNLKSSPLDATETKRSRFVESDFISCTNCSKKLSGKSFYQSKNTVLPPGTWVCSNKCENQLGNNQEFIEHFSHVSDLDMLRFHLGNVCLDGK